MATSPVVDLCFDLSDRPHVPHEDLSGSFGIPFGRGRGGGGLIWMWIERGDDSGRMCFFFCIYFPVLESRERRMAMEAPPNEDPSGSLGPIWTVDRSGISTGDAIKSSRNRIASKRRCRG